MADWMDLKDAVEQAEEMVITVLVQVSRLRKPLETFFVQVDGLKEMDTLLKAFQKLKKLKKIKDFTLTSLSHIPTTTVEALKGKIK